jgi:Kef-type K+ transport system membrane component KefB
LSESNRTKPKNYLYYIALLAIFGLGIWLILATGSKLNPPKTATSEASQPVTATSATVDSTSSSIAKFLRLSDRSALSILLLQIIVIIVVAKLFGTVFRRIGQPPVMGEMVAGIALGPSILGWLSPQTSAFLFPQASMLTLGVFSQVGVVLFMFIVGMELDLQHLRERASSAIMVSHASIVVPFLLGAALALVLYPSLAPPNTSFTAFALFMGIAMSITAFPVLARILKDRGLAQSALGNMALACASIDDVTAWCILAFVIAIVKARGFGHSVLILVLTLLFVVVMLLILKPRIEAFIIRRIKDETYSRLMMAGILAFALTCAWFTETIGIHALFGGFLAGVVIPSSPGVQAFLKERIEGFSSTALLPLFFVFTGLRTQVTLLNDWNSWLMCLAIVVVAVVGKLLGSMLMARWTKMSWRDSFSIGVLMNTRGLIELVVLNIGYDLGILSARIFVMMVIMALATTFMTAPLLSFVKLGKAQ